MDLFKIGAQAPSLTLNDLEGRPTSLADVLGSKLGAVVVFWSGICSHCQRYDAYLNTFANRHRDLALVAVASRQDESLSDLVEIASRRGLSFPILHDRDRRVARAWQVEQTPRVFLLDAQSRLVYRGAIDNFKYPRDPDYQAYLESAIEDLAASRPVRRDETPSFGCPVESVYYTMSKP